MKILEILTSMPKSCEAKFEILCDSLIGISFTDKRNSPIGEKLLKDYGYSERFFSISEYRKRHPLSETNADFIIEGSVF